MGRMDITDLFDWIDESKGIELMLRMVIGLIILIVWVFGMCFLFITFPVWIIPYVIICYIKKNKGEQNV